jgi:hypothetical protein
MSTFGKYYSEARGIARIFTFNTALWPLNSWFFDRLDDGWTWLISLVW